MTPKDEAFKIYQEAYKLIEKYKTREPVLHHRLLAKHFSLMVVDKILSLSFLQNGDSHEIIDEAKYIYWEKVRTHIQNDFKDKVN